MSEIAFLSFNLRKIYSPIRVILNWQIDRRNIFAVAIFLARRFYLKLQGTRVPVIFVLPVFLKPMFSPSRRNDYL